MKIASYTGEKNLGDVARHLFGLPTKAGAKQLSKAEAALLSANPHLHDLKHVKDGTPILVPAVRGLQAADHPSLFQFATMGINKESSHSAAQLQSVTTTAVELHTADADRLSRVLKSKPLKDAAGQMPEVKARLDQISAAAKSRHAGT